MFLSFQKGNFLAVLVWEQFSVFWYYPTSMWWSCLSVTFTSDFFVVHHSALLDIIIPLVLMSSPANIALLLPYLLALGRIKDRDAMAINSEPSFTYIFTLTISIHCKFLSHSVVSRTHYQLFTDLSSSGAYHCMCCKISIWVCMWPGLADAFTGYGVIYILYVK